MRLIKTAVPNCADHQEMPQLGPVMMPMAAAIRGSEAVPSRDRAVTISMESIAPSPHTIAFSPPTMKKPGPFDPGYPQTR